MVNLGFYTDEQYHNIFVLFLIKKCGFLQWSCVFPPILPVWIAAATFNRGSEQHLKLLMHTVVGLLLPHITTASLICLVQMCTDLQSNATRHMQFPASLSEVLFCSVSLTASFIVSS